MSSKSQPRIKSSTVTFDADKLVSDPSVLSKVHEHLNSNDLRSAVVTAFSLPSNDNYVYHATASVTLNQAQTAINAGPSHGLHDWYLERDDSNGKLKPIGRPELSDIAGYIALFDPSKGASNSLKGFLSNAKKASLRFRIAEYLSSKRYLDGNLVISKSKKGHINPYVDFWAWSCRNLEWAGPEIGTINIKMSHHVLPVFMHHFGCACPSYESLEIIKKMSENRTILDVGSGNGYWTFMLRRQGCEVIGIDNGQSKWRTCWIDDTVHTDGIRFIKKRPGGASEDLLLMVYPVVGLDFTTSVLNAYKGDIVCIAGTQNENGYTGFKNEMVDSWMAREREDFDKVAQVPLPSFAGKDDALFVFRRKT